MESEDLQKKMNDPHHSLSLEPVSTPASFPSPASSLIPPPTLSAHEFAIKTSRIIASKKRDTTGSIKHPITEPLQVNKPPGLDQDTTDDSNTPVATTPSNRISSEQKDVHADQHRGQKRNSEPPGDMEDRSAHPPTPKSKRFSTPAGLQNIQGSPSIPPAPGSPLGVPAYYPAINDSKRSSLASNRPAPSSPTPSRHSSLLPARHSSKRYSSNLNPNSLTNNSPQPQRKRASHILVKIRDFAFPQDDERHSTVKRLKISSSSRNSYASSDKRKSSGSGWSGFFTASAAKFGFGKSGSERSSRLSGTSSSPSQQVQQLSDEHGSSSSLSGESDQYQEDEDQYDNDEDMEFVAEPEREFVPGYYRAMYAFEPEGTAEMALQEDQEVKCIARGGGVGWVVALKDNAPGSRAKQALVPEGYLEFVRYFEEGELEGYFAAASADDPGTPKPTDSVS